MAGRRFALLFSFVAFTFSFTVHGDDNDPIVVRMKADITYLASDECEGRGPGTKGIDLAADYIAKSFAKSGLKPGGVNGTWFQPFTVSGGSKLDKPGEVIL